MRRQSVLILLRATAEQFNDPLLVLDHKPIPAITLATCTANALSTARLSSRDSLLCCSDSPNCEWVRPLSPLRASEYLFADYSEFFSAHFCHGLDLGNFWLVCRF